MLAPKHFGLLSALLALSLCSACQQGAEVFNSGTPSSTNLLYSQNAKRIDYYLAKAVWNAKIDFTPSGGSQSSPTPAKFAITTDAAPTALADFSMPMHLVYNHDNFANDQIDVTLSAGLLTKITTTTVGAGDAIIQGLSAVLTSAASVQKATSVASTATKTLALAIARATCTEPLPLETSLSVDLTYGGNNTSSYAVTSGGDCAILIDKRILSYDHSGLAGALGTTDSFSSKVSLPGATSNLASADLDATSAVETASKLLGKALFFRIGKPAFVDIHAYLVNVAAYNKLCAKGLEACLTTDLIDQKSAATCSNTKWCVMDADLKLATPGPVPVDCNSVGYVKFDRDAFVQNVTTVAFANGVLSEFSANNPAEGTGILQISADLLKSVSLLIPL